MMRRIKVVLLAALSLLSVLATGDPAFQGDFPVSEDESLQSRPTLAYDANHDRFLVTWTDFRNRRSSGVDIYGRLLDARGKPIGGDFPISSARRGQGTSAVAFDPLHNRYLVVWADWRDARSVDSDIYGRLLSADGSLYGEEFPIARRRVSQKQPTVAFDPFHRRFLVIWKDYRGMDVERLYGQFIDPQGDLFGDEFAVAKGVGKQDRPSLYYDQTRKRFLVVWRDIVDEHQYLTTPLKGKGIFAAFIDAERGPQGGTGSLIDTEEDACLPPSLYAADYAPEEDVFLVVWTTARDYEKQGLDVYGAFVRAKDGKRQGRAFPIAVESDYQEFPSVAYDPTHHRFLVIWYDLRRDHRALNQDVYGRYITVKGEFSEEFLVSDFRAPGIRRYPAISFSPKSDSFFMIWEDSRSKTKTTHSQRIYGRIL
ncbi:MAG: hypothetical protein ACYTG0_45725 [Planctomycetota bacterium]